MNYLYIVPPGRGYLALVIKIKLGRWTRLPRLGKNAFKDLMRSGVKYESGRGFLVDTDADLKKVRYIISGALNGAPVEFIFNCLVCGREVSCRDCSYRVVCSIEDSSHMCLCKECLRERGGEYFGVLDKLIQGSL